MFTLALFLAACDSSLPPAPFGGVAEALGSTKAEELGLEAAPAAVRAVGEGTPGFAQTNPNGFADPRPIDRDPFALGGPNHAEVRLGAPYTPPAEGPGVLFPSEQPGVLAEIAYNAGYLQRCWTSRAKTVRTGRIVIHAHIGTDGLVGGQCVGEDSIGDPHLRRLNGVAGAPLAGPEFRPVLG
jgi:hypothetical protein